MDRTVKAFGDPATLLLYVLSIREVINDTLL